MTTYNTLSFTLDNNVATITLNRPAAANGINTELSEELVLAAQACDSDSRIKAVILTGAGRFFSAGGDVKAMHSFGDDIPRELKYLADQLHRANSTFARMDAPLIVAVNGIAAGAGFSLAVTGDIVIAAQSASFTMAYSNVGLSPDGGASYFLPRLIGLRRTQELMLTNRTLKAEEALEWGMLNQVVADDQLLATAQSVAGKLARGARGSNSAIKQLLLQTYSNSLETQMEQESRYISNCSASADGREGVQAFVDKRKPEFN